MTELPTGLIETKGYPRTICRDCDCEANECTCCEEYLDHEGKNPIYCYQSESGKDGRLFCSSLRKRRNLNE